MTEIWHIADDIGPALAATGQNGLGTGWLEKPVRHRDAGIFLKIASAERL